MNYGIFNQKPIRDFPQHIMIYDMGASSTIATVLNYQLFKVALTRACLSLENITHVVLVGAGTRVPRVRKVLSAYVQKALTKSMNTDEAAALGAVYRAADLSKGFKVKKLMTRDVVITPIEITCNMTHKEVKKVLFEKMNTYP